MIMEYFKAPMHCIDGEPAYKSGEWGGLKSCKFGPTRRVIRPVSKESIFDNRILPIYGRKHFGLSHSKEKEFVPCLKVAVNVPNKTNRNESIGIVKIDFTQNKDRPEKKHKFGYIGKQTLETKEKFNSLDVNTIIKQELNFITKLGSSKKDYNKFLSEKIHAQKEYDDKKIITREKEKIEANQRLDDQEKIHSNTALQHVNSLKTWEKTTLPKIGKI